jgi:hypothetical protein
VRGLSCSLTAGRCGPSAADFRPLAGNLWSPYCRRSDRSAAGAIADIKQGTWLHPPRLTIAPGPDRRRFVLSSRSQLMDARGGVTPATSRLPPAVDGIEPNDRVVVLYRSVRFHLTARLIRVLPGGR